jgi:pimeloyl-ACP methyl ester carboxylesterase
MPAVSAMPASLPPVTTVRCAHGAVAWRDAGTGPAVVLLHGIGSGSGSWRGQFDALAAHHRVLAWDAPGYGDSDPLPQPHPMAMDYAHVLGQCLAQLGVTPAVVVGHSLGAIVAVAFAAHVDRAVPPAAIVLASPARGYGSADVVTRAAKLAERRGMIERLGVQGMAQSRSAALCAPGASDEVLAVVHDSMARATPGGYVQAAGMLAYDDLAVHLRAASSPPVRVLCGELDRVTPPDACRAVAHDAGAPFVLLKGVAHACYVEDAAQFNDALAPVLAAAIEAARVTAPPAVERRGVAAAAPSTSLAAAPSTSLAAAPSTSLAAAPSTSLRTGPRHG